MPSPSLLRRYSQVFPAASAGARLPAILKQRRRAHLDALDSFAIFSGVPREPGAENIWIMPALKIFQEPSVIYLTGINQPQVILALVPADGKKGGKKGGHEILFVPEKNPDREFWDGVRFGYPPGKNAARSQDVNDVRALTGIDDVRPLAEFEAWFDGLVKATKKTFGYAFYHQYDDQGKLHVTKTDHNYAFRQTLEKEARAAKKGFEIRSCAALHYRLRLPLDTDQARDVAKAVAITNDAFKETLAKLGRPGSNTAKTSKAAKIADENALAAHLQYGMLRRSPYGLAFPSIVASGRNATVLHYLKNDEPLDPKGLVLLDFGARWGTMHADISRTIPVSGKYNPLQALLYNIVLDAAKENQRNAKPGATIRVMNEKVWAFLEDALEKRFLSKGGKAERAYKGKPHGVSHLMGEQEHDGDPHRLYQDYALQPGWQISNEPGLYGHFSITLGGKRYSEWIGIRIEDDLLITKTGCRNLSASIPREIPEIEALMKG